MAPIGFFATSIVACFQRGSFSAAFECLGNTELGTFLIPFLLVFAIIYAVLSSDKLKVVSGNAAALISLALALLIAFQVQSLNMLSKLLSGISTPFIVIIVGIILAWVIWGLVKDESPSGDVQGISYSSIIFFIIVIAMIFFFGSRIFGGMPSGAGFLQGNTTVIIIGILSVIIIAWLLSSGSGSSSEDNGGPGI